MPNIIFDTQRTIENNLQANTIGLFKHKDSNIIQLVLQIDNDILKLVCIKHLGFIQVSYLNKNDGKLFRFPTGKSLLDILQDPIEYNILFETFLLGNSF